jgi:hypothetical protein
VVKRPLDSNKLGILQTILDKPVQTRTFALYYEYRNADSKKQKAIQKMTNPQAPIEIDDIRIGVQVFLPTSAGSINSPAGKTTVYKPYTVHRYYKHGYEDRATVVSSSGERRIRWRNNAWYTEDSETDPISFVQLIDSNFSNFDLFLL